MTRLRVGTWNIKGGRGARDLLDPGDKTRYLDQIAQVIFLKGLQVVVLQEVDVWARRSGRVHQPCYLARRLARLTGDKWRYVFAKAIPLGWGAYGNAILTSLPIKQVTRVSLAVPGQKAEKRVFLFARMLLPGNKPVGAGCFHLSARDASLRLQEAEKIKTSLHGDLFPLPPFFLGGDLNEERHGTVYRKMLEDKFSLKDLGPLEGSSYRPPDTGFRARIDYLFGYGISACSSGVVAAGDSSDHDLIWAECEIG